jgi:hypothetical protein
MARRIKNSEKPPTKAKKPRKRKLTPRKRRESKVRFIFAPDTQLTPEQAAEAEKAADKAIDDFISHLAQLAAREYRSR